MSEAIDACTRARRHDLSTDDGWRRWLEEHSRTIYPHGGKPVRFRVEIEKSVTATVRDATRGERVRLWLRRMVGRVRVL